MKGSLIALLVSLVVHIGLFLLIMIGFQKPLVIDHAHAEPLNLVMVVQPIAELQTVTRPQPKPELAESKTLKAIETTQEAPQKIDTVKKPVRQKKVKTTDTELNEMILAYQKSLQPSNQQKSDNLNSHDQKKKDRNRKAQSPETTDHQPSQIRPTASTKRVNGSNLLQQTAHQSDPAAEQRYKARLHQLLAQRQHYPLRAKRRQQQGTTTVSFIVYPNGEIVNIRVKTSSGNRQLDQAAIRTIRQLSGKLPFPTSISRQQWSFSLPIVYRLD